MMRMAMIVAAGTLAACSPTPAAEQPGNATPAPAETFVPGGPGDPVMAGCNASKAQGLVGRLADAAVQADAQRLAGAKTLRVIPPGAMVTMDYRTDRLNMKTDAVNRILSIDCG